LKNKSIKLPFVTKNKNIWCHLLTIKAASKLKTHLVHNKPVANPDFELRKNGFVLLALPTFLPSVISSFFTRNKEERIFSHTIYLYNKKFDWLVIVDPI